VSRDGHDRSYSYENHTNSVHQQAGSPYPHERITHIGGAQNGGWKITQEQAINFIERKEWAFWVQPPNAGESVWVVVAISRYGHKYLKTENDGEDQNNLLSLPECP
jgi:hypothetical protein